MDWSLAIDINRQALKRVLAALVAMARLGEVFASPSILPRHLHRAVLRLLRPAEAAVRRLVIAAARGIVVAPPDSRRARPGPSPSGAPDGAAPRTLSFPLLDPLRDPLRFRRPNTARGVPRIWSPGEPDPFPIPPRRDLLPDDPVSAVRLGLRLAALDRVLDDLPRAAKRFARWRHRVAAGARNGAFRAASAATHRRWPLKPGRPPGSRGPRSRGPDHEIDEIVDATHGLALWALNHPDTS